jgi:translation elongation factor EF-Ts
VLAEINCETDFVARTTEFLNFSTNLLAQVISDGAPISDATTYLSKPITNTVFGAPSIEEA